MRRNRFLLTASICNSSDIFSLDYLLRSDHLFIFVPKNRLVFSLEMRDSFLAQLPMNLEDNLIYFQTAKVEQTQTHSLETEENTHRIISKLVNIVLTVFAIILLLLSTIKNLVQSR